MTPYNTGTSGSSASTTEQTQSNPVGAATSAMQMLGGLFTGIRWLSLAVRAACSAAPTVV